MLHDGHQLNTVVTWTKEQEQMDRKKRKFSFMGKTKLVLKKKSLSIQYDTVIQDPH